MTLHDFLCLLTGAWWLLMTAAAGTAIGGSAAVVWPARHRIISILTNQSKDQYRG